MVTGGFTLLNSVILYVLLLGAILLPILFAGILWIQKRKKNAISK
jgi:hypothetical protein